MFTDPSPSATPVTVPDVDTVRAANPLPDVDCPPALSVTVPPPLALNDTLAGPVHVTVLDVDALDGAGGTYSLSLIHI